MKASPSKTGRKPVSREAILKAVATSTAVETGESSKAIEAKLRARKSKSRFKSLRLA